MSLSDRFEEALQKSRKEMEERGYTERLTVMRDVVTSLRQVGIAAEMKPDLDGVLPYGESNLSESWPRRRFLLEIDGARFGVYFGEKRSRSSSRHATRDSTQYLWLTTEPFKNTDGTRLNVREFDLTTEGGRHALEETLLKFVADRETSRELMPGADAKSNPANGVRKTKSPVKLG